MKILITGAAGFIGHHLVHALAHQAQIVALDNLKTGKAQRLKGSGCKWIEADVEQIQAVAQAAQDCDWIIHLAALSSVAESLEQPARCIQSNIMGLLNILETARTMRKPCRVLFASSCAVYGNSTDLPQHENLTPQPTSAYAASKLSGEYLCQIYSQCYKVPTLVLRFFNVYGSGQDAQSAYAAVIPRFVDLARRSQPLVIYGNGEQTRDFIHVDDVIQTISMGIEKGLMGVFNVGAGEEVSILELARKILQITGSHSPIHHLPLRSGEILRSYANIDRLKKKGFQPRVSLKKGLQLMIE